MARRCPHGKRIKTFASCEICRAEINALAVARLASRYARMQEQTVAIRYEKDNRERTETPALTLDKVIP